MSAEAEELAAGMYCAEKRTRLEWVMSRMNYLSGEWGKYDAKAKAYEAQMCLAAPGSRELPASRMAEAMRAKDMIAVDLYDICIDFALEAKCEESRLRELIEARAK